MRSGPSTTPCRPVQPAAQLPHDTSIIAAMVFVVSCAEHSDTPHEENTSEAPLHLKQEVQATPFATIDKAPIFPGCEEVASEAQKNCFTQKVHIFTTSVFI